MSRMTETATMTDSKTVRDFGVDGIMSSMRAFIEALPPRQTAKDIKFLGDKSGVYGFMISEGCRAGIYFHDDQGMRRFIANLRKRNDYRKHPIHSQHIDGGHSVGGLRLRVADQRTWNTVVPSCSINAYIHVDAWLTGKSWDDAWDAWVAE